MNAKLAAQFYPLLSSTSLHTKEMSRVGASGRDSLTLIRVPRMKVNAAGVQAGIRTNLIVCVYSIWFVSCMLVMR